MADPDVAPPPAEPAPEPPPGRRRFATLLEWLQRVRGPVVAIAGVGAVLSGLVGYWNVYRTVHDGHAAHSGAAPDAPAGGRTTAAAPKSLAVLAFVNLGDDRKSDVFVDGLSEELLTLLSQVPGLKVTARNSSFQFRGKPTPMADVARQLGVTYLIDGSVRQAGDRVRVSAQLINPADGSVLWSDTFDRDVKDVLAAQLELALQIARSLKLPLDASTLVGSGTRNAQAWQLFLQGQRMPLGQRENFYLRALALDPRFARVHVELAREVFRNANRQTSPPDPKDVSARARAHANDALRIDPNSSQAYVMLAGADLWLDDMDAWALHAKRVMALDPNDGDAHDLAAELYLNEGRMDAALTEKKRSMELNPLDDIGHAEYASLLRLANQPVLALQEIDRALSINPNDFRNHAVKARVLLDLGRPDEALALARRAAAQLSASEWRWLPVDVLVRAGTPEDLVALDRLPRLTPGAKAYVGLARGDVDGFLHWLETGKTDVSYRSRALFNPDLDAVRTLPRFKAWLEKFHLGQAQELASAWRAANPASTPTPR